GFLCELHDVGAHFVVWQTTFTEVLRPSPCTTEMAHWEFETLTSLGLYEEAQDVACATSHNVFADWSAVTHYQFGLTDLLIASLCGTPHRRLTDGLIGEVLWGKFLAILLHVQDHIVA